MIMARPPVENQMPTRSGCSAQISYEFTTYSEFIILAIFAVPHGSYEYQTYKVSRLKQFHSCEYTWGDGALEAAE